MGFTAIINVGAYIEAIPQNYMKTKYLTVKNLELIHFLENHQTKNLDMYIDGFVLDSASYNCSRQKEGGTNFLGRCIS